MATLGVAIIGGIVAAGAAYLLSPKIDTSTKGARLSSSTLTTSTEGAGMAQLFGRQRLDGQIIWATKFNETTIVTAQQGGGKGGGSGGGTSTTYEYSISLAIAFCEGNAKTSLSRLWADGKEIDISSLNLRYYGGGEDQTPDPHIEAVQGVGTVPAYRGVAYVVIEDMQLKDYGNRVPQLTAEIVVPLDTDDEDDIQNAGEAFCLIPASGETVYQAEEIQLVTGGSAASTNPIFGTITGGYTTKPDNVHNAFRKPDIVHSIDNLVRMQDNLDAVLLVVSWFGDDLRAGSCQIRPRIEDATRKLLPDDWTVGTYTRTTAQEVPKDADGRPEYGGTPSDASIISCIQYLKSKGLRVVFYPFILMVQQDGNTLPTPYSDNESIVGQPAKPWRGRITCSPAAGFAGTPDTTAAAGTQINAFFDEYDEMVEHYADLCATAGGVDGFIVGTELPGITFVRDALGSYPAVTRLKQLAAYSKSALPASNIGYAADWSEWVHDNSDGYWFHLDPLWSDPNIDFCGVDNYLPLSDWRDGTQHADYDDINGPTSEYDVDYLSSQIEGGEYWDYFYASPADRVNQIRTPISDGLHGEDWIFRRKDFVNWWSQSHRNRPGGVRDATPTDWVPASKPIWFTEFGVPAIDKGTNQPNVFFDPTSSESAIPYFSSGSRDDFIQRLGVETTYKYWKANAPEIGGLKMLEPNNMFVWTWDARPFPDYPVRDTVWSDGDLWFKGHWWTGRIESIPLARLIGYLCKRAGLTSDQYDVTGLNGPGALVRGFQIDEPEPIRDSIKSLMDAYQFDAFESEGKIKFLLRVNTRVSEISGDSYVVSNNDPNGVQVTRGQETELPQKVTVSYIDEFNGYNVGAVDGKTSRGYSQNNEKIEVKVNLTQDYAQGLADARVQQKWIERITGKVVLPPSMVRFDPGDAVTFPISDYSITGRFSSISRGEKINVEYLAFDPNTFRLPNVNEEERLPGLVGLFGEVITQFMDLPLFTGDEPLPHAPRIACTATPWPGGVNVFKFNAEGVYTFNAVHPYRNAIGELTAPLKAGTPGLFDRNNVLSVSFEFGSLLSTTEAGALERAYALGVFNAAKDEWEVIQFAEAVLTGTNSYDVSLLLRGQLGTAHAMGEPEVPTGSRVVLLEPQLLTPINVTFDAADTAITYRYGPSRYDVADNTYKDLTYSGKRVGLRPYSPVGLLLSQNADSDLSISWKRRTRFDGDSWATTEVPLNEESEQYRLDIYDGVSVVRSVVVTSPNYVYTEADQIEDFGAAQTTLTLDVAQFGAAFGNYGKALSGQFNVTKVTP